MTAYVCTQLVGQTCAAWQSLNEAATDFSEVGITSESLGEAFAWGFAVVTIFAVSGWAVKIVRQIIRDTFRVDDHA